MLRYLLIFLMIFQAPIGFARSKSQSESRPFEYDVAAAAVNTLKDLETVNGVLTWASEFIPKEEIAKTRKLMAKLGVHESDYLPDFQVKDNKIYYGRDSITIEPGFVVVNKKKYKIDGRSFYDYMLEICKDNKCGKDGQYSWLHKLTFEEANALGILVWFGLGVVAGVLGTWLWRRYQRKREQRRYEEERPLGEIFDARNFVDYDLYKNRKPGERYICESNSIYLYNESGVQTCQFDRCAERLRVNPRYWPRAQGCANSARLMNNAVARNASPNSRSHDLRDEAERSTTSVPETTPTHPKGFKKWQPRRPF